MFQCCTTAAQGCDRNTLTELWIWLLFTALQDERDVIPLEAEVGNKLLT